jgi:hypothetical protein
MKPIKICFSSIFAVLILASSTIAQDSTRLFAIHEDVVIPAMSEKFENATKDFMKALKQNGFDFSIRSSQTDDYHYLFLTPLKNYGDLDKMNESFDKVIKKMGMGNWRKMMSGFDGVYEYHRDFTAKLDEDLSYKPKNPRLKIDEASFLHWDFYNFYEDNGSKIDKLGKDFKALYNTKEIPNGYDVWMTDIGDPYSTVIVVSWAKDAVDFYTESKKDNEMLGDAANKIWKEEAMPILKHFEHKNGKIRRDLSYIAESK